jgi:hypothetical protein
VTDDIDNRARREADKTHPPDEIMFSDPPGPVLWAEVYRGGERIGAVWMTTQPLTTPRAGIVLAPGVYDGDFQDDLGDLTLRVRFNTEAVAAEWLEHLSETRTGLGNTLAVGEHRSADTVGDVRSALGWKL